jgi:hypothetical protein
MAHTGPAVRGLGLLALFDSIALAPSSIVLTQTEGLLNVVTGSCRTCSVRLHPPSSSSVCCSHALEYAAGAEPHGGAGSVNPDDFFKISDKLLFIMKPTPTAQ